MCQCPKCLSEADEPDVTSDEEEEDMDDDGDQWTEALPTYSDNFVDWLLLSANQSPRCASSRGHISTVYEDFLCLSRLIRFDLGEKYFIEKWSLTSPTGKTVYRNWNEIMLSVFAVYTCQNDW